MFVRERNKFSKISLFFMLVITIFLTCGLRVNAASTTVSDWSGLETALANPAIDEINVDSNLTATKNITVNRSVLINFNDKKVNLSSGGLSVSTNGDIKIKNIEIFGNYESSLFTGSGKATVTGNLVSSPESHADIALMPGGTLVFDGAKVVYDKVAQDMSQKKYEYTSAIITKNFTITNKSSVLSNAEKFYGTNASEKDITNTDAVIRIDKQSVVETNSMKTTPNQDRHRGQAWDVRVESDIYIEDEGTVLNVNGNGIQTNDTGGIFVVQASNSTINVLNGAEFNVFSEKTSGVLLMSKGGSVNLNRGKLNIKTNGQSNSFGAALRFRWEGDMTFNIDNHSEFKVEKTAESAPAIRMFGGNNAINVSGESDFIVKNKGDGTPTKPGGSAANQGILYTDGDNNSFNLKDENSNVSIQADFGAAIDSKGKGIGINSGEGTYFVARGNTGNNKEAIFNAGKMVNNMFKPKYFDFANTSGKVFENSSTSSLETKGTDLSVWQVGANHKGNPFDSWTLIDFVLTGSDYSKVQSSSDPSFTSKFGKAADYSRMTANNQAAKITGIRTPTDADKYVYVDVEVPEGKHDEDRPAYDGEVGVKIGLYDSSGNEIKQLKERTTTEKIYGEPDKQGIAKFAIPNGEFIKAGMTVKVLSAWRGSGEEGSNKVHMSRPEDILVKEATAIDVTPPKTVTFDGNLTSGKTNISGTSDEDGAKLFFKNKDAWLKDASGNLVTTTVVNGKWSVKLPKQLEKDTNLEIFAKDSAVLDKDSIPYALPDSYTQDPNSASGNLNIPAKDYATYKGYHDATGKDKFAQSLVIEVTDVMPNQPKISKIARALTKDKNGDQKPQTDYDTDVRPEDWKGTITKVNNTLSYRIVVQIPGKTGEEKDKILYNANVTDELPEGLTFDKSKVKVWKYTKGNAADGGMPYRHETDVNEGGTRKFNMGDIDIAKSEATEFTDKASIDYKEDTRMLTVGIGDTTAVPETEYIGANEYGVLLPGDNIVIEVPTVVTPQAVKNDIKNKATIKGFGGVIETENPLTYKEVTAESNVAVNPGGKVVGELLLVSAPENLTFGEVKMLDYDKAVGSDKTSIDKPLVVKDTLKDKDWKVTIKLTEDLTYKKNGNVHTLPDSLYVRYKNKNTILSLNDSVKVYESDLASVENTKEEFNISDDWSKDLSKDGIKLKASQLPKAETYQGKVQWALENTQ